MTWSSNSAGSNARSPRRGRDVVAWSPDDLGELSMVVPTAGASAAHAAPLPADLLEEARRMAFNEGFRAGEDSEHTRLFQAAQALQDGVSSVQEGVDRWISNAEENISALAIAVARHILSHDVTVNREATMDVVKQAIAEFSIDHPVTVRLNPADHAVIVPMLHAVEGGGARHATEWIADARIAAGGCIVEGRERIIDGRIDAALERVYRRLTYTGA